MGFARSGLIELERTGEYDILVRSNCDYRYSEKGRRKLTTKLDRNQKEELLRMYNTQNDDNKAAYSTRKLASYFSLQTGRKVTTADVSNILHELENQNHKVNWRGSCIKRKAQYEDKKIDAEIPIMPTLQPAHSEDKKEEKLGRLEQMLFGFEAGVLGMMGTAAVMSLTLIPSVYRWAESLHGYFT